MHRKIYHLIWRRLIFLPQFMQLCTPTLLQLSVKSLFDSLRGLLLVAERKGFSFHACIFKQCWIYFYTLYKPENVAP